MINIAGKRFIGTKYTVGGTEKAASMRSHKKSPTNPDLVPLVTIASNVGHRHPAVRNGIFAATGCL